MIERVKQTEDCLWVYVLRNRHGQIVAQSRKKYYKKAEAEKACAELMKEIYQQVNRKGVRYNEH